jgi:hypothetical protein
LPRFAAIAWWAHDAVIPKDQVGVHSSIGNMITKSAAVLNDFTVPLVK